MYSLRIQKLDRIFPALSLRVLVVPVLHFGKALAGFSPTFMGRDSMPAQRTGGFREVIEMSFNFITPIISHSLENSHASVLRSTLKICSELRMTTGILLDHYGTWALDVVIKGITALMSAFYRYTRLATAKAL